MRPPICPKTKGWIELPGRIIFIAGVGAMDERKPLVRELIARHQCCAWKDRAERWRCLFRRSEFGGWICGVAFEAGHEAEHRAYQWREWERKGVLPS